MGTRLTSLNTKALEKLAREHELPLPPMATKTEEEKKLYRKALLIAIDRKLGEEEVDIEEKAEEELELEAVPEAQVEAPQQIARQEVRCKNCDRELVALNDWHVMTPPGFGRPNTEYILENSYCSGCAVAANELMLPKWDVTKIRIT